MKNHNSNQNNLSKSLTGMTTNFADALEALFNIRGEIENENK